MNMRLRADHRTYHDFTVLNMLRDELRGMKGAGSTRWYTIAVIEVGAAFGDRRAPEEGCCGRACSTSEIADGFY
jgi:hypothetical protein